MLQLFLTSLLKALLCRGEREGVQTGFEQRSASLEKKGLRFRLPNLLHWPSPSAPALSPSPTSSAP